MRSIWRDVLIADDDDRLPKNSQSYLLHAFARGDVSNGANRLLHWRHTNVIATRQHPPHSPNTKKRPCPPGTAAFS